VGEEWLRSAVEAALRVAMPDGPVCQVGLVITDDQTVRGLNRDFRGLDEVTDVLAFSASHAGQWEGEADVPGDSGEPAFVLPPDQPPPLGEVIISYPQAQRQASERGEPLDQELALLIVHGVLHLAGHDHLEPQAEAEMQGKERAALEAMP
jgi:probable rRNA maturation factor